MSGAAAPDLPARDETQRLDKWLWFARLVKSRTLAAHQIGAGKIRVNRVKVVKPSQTVKPGDVITSAAEREVLVVRVLAPGVRRGPAPEAARLYERLSGGRETVPRPVAARPGERAVGSGRPTKRERRQIDQFRGRT